MTWSVLPTDFSAHFPQETGSVSGNKSGEGLFVYSVAFYNGVIDKKKKSFYVEKSVTVLSTDSSVHSFLENSICLPPSERQGRTVCEMILCEELSTMHLFLSMMHCGARMFLTKESYRIHQIAKPWKLVVKIFFVYKRKPMEL